LGSIGLLWVDASIWQMMRGAIIIFGAILSLTVLKRKLFLHNWLGITLVVIGLVLVGASGFLKNSNSDSNVDPKLFLVGIVLVIAAQLIQASQMIIEELLLKKRHFEPLNVVFMEGFWGVVIMSLVVFPALALVHAPAVSPDLYPTARTNPVFDIFSENLFDSIYQMMQQPIFFVECFIILFSIAFFNFFGLSLTRYLSTVHRTLIDACRTVTVWLFQVILFYVGLPNAGEQLGYYSIIQLTGFLFLVTGTIIYNEVLKIPCSTYQKVEDM